MRKTILTICGALLLLLGVSCQKKQANFGTDEVKMTDAKHLIVNDDTTFTGELWDEGSPATIINVGCMMEYVNYRPCTLEELLAANPSPVIKQTDDENRGK